MIGKIENIQAKGSNDTLQFAIITLSSINVESLEFNS